jgi:hypothetical protein
MTSFRAVQRVYRPSENRISDPRCRLGGSPKSRSISWIRFKFLRNGRILRIISHVGRLTGQSIKRCCKVSACDLQTSHVSSLMTCLSFKKDQMGRMLWLICQRRLRATGEKCLACSFFPYYESIGGGVIYCFRGGYYRGQKASISCSDNARRVGEDASPIGENF